MKRAALIAVAVLAGCSGDVDEAWQLDHDRIIAVRATPPRIAPGGRAELDALVGRRAAPPREEVPPVAVVSSPARMAGALALDGGRWVVTAPGDEELASIRAELGLAAGAPVPVVIAIEHDGFAATKTVWVGEPAANPVIAGATVAGTDALDREALVIGRGVDVLLAVDRPDTDDVNWLTSCGTMHDYDLPRAYLRVEPDDPDDGHLAVVVRTPDGGVSWRIWSIRAD